MFAGVKKSAYLSGFCPHLFVGVHTGSASTAALLLPFTANCAALPARGFVVQLTGQKKAIVANLAITSATYSWSNAGSKSVGDCRRFRASHEFTYVACFLPHSPHGIGGRMAEHERGSKRESPSGG